MFGLDSVAQALVGNTIGKVVDKALTFIPDPEAREKARQAVMQMDLSADAAQISVNLEEAKSEKWWKAGWRPFVGWVCGGAYAYNFVIERFLEMWIVVFDPAFNVAMLPKLDMAELSAALFGMLGLGYMRSQEKQAITAAKNT